MLIVDVLSFYKPMYAFRLIREAFARKCISERTQYQCDGRESLLAVDDPKGLSLLVFFLDDQGADEVINLIV